MKVKTFNAILILCMALIAVILMGSGLYGLSKSQQDEKVEAIHSESAFVDNYNNSNISIGCEAGPLMDESLNISIGGIRIIRKSCPHDEIMGMRMILKHSEGREFFLCKKCFSEYEQTKKEISKQLMKVLEQLTSEDEGEKLISLYWREGQN